MLPFKFSYTWLIIPVIAYTASYCIQSLKDYLNIFQGPSLDRGTLPVGYETTKEMILANGFGYQDYRVQTEDGYILRVHRIIGHQPGGLPVLFSHGLSTSSESFLIRGRKTTLAFQLADAGFDVWLYDRRGNWYSREHVKYKPNTWDFWNFSFHESGYYDTPAVIDHTISLTNHSKIIFVGHSMGSTDYAVMASLRPEYNDKVKLAIFLGPTWITPQIKELSSPFARFIFNGFELFYQFAMRTSIYEILPKENSVIETLEKCCKPSSKLQTACLWSYRQLVGEDANSINETEFLEMATHWPSGASLKTYHHMNQIFKLGFVQYDYGEKENLIRYKNVTPPAYPLHKVTSPVAIYWGNTDPFLNERTIKEIEQQFPNIVENHRIEDTIFNHADYVFARKSKHLLNNRIIKLIKSFQ
ncbi:hypothetical protein O3M35_005511 [Rhynocoris fuscipes]|uniref:Lipase n=1 Tax=Rhynocoris fuscipes TaxID=488301 RepID=A0AAW1DQK6_9HEMI